MTFAAALLALVGRVVFSFVDPAITESSGLVDLGSVMVTTNDSGGGPEVFVVDPSTGRTVGRTTFTDEVVDVEALAPAGGDHVWVGDIGDNDAQRDSVQVYRVPVGRSDRTVRAPAYELVYPDGPHDAESVVAAGGRLLVVTKGLFGGVVYAAPRHLDRDHPNRLEPVGEVDVWATDAALFPDGRHLLVRGYDTAAIYTFPALRPVASFDLPRQNQGEGVSVGASGRVRLSSEGRNSAVLQVQLPDEVRALVVPAAPSPSSSPGRATERPVRTDTEEAASAALPTWVVGGGTLVALAAAGLAVVVVRRRRGGNDEADRRPR